MYDHPIPAFSRFDEAHMEKVWDILREKFHFNVVDWKKDFRSFLGKQPRNTQVTDAFLIFGDRAINPILNGILKRRPSHPTWQNLIRHVIDPVAKRGGQIRNGYTS